MFDKSWCDHFAGGVTICNPQGIILYMNEKSALIWADDGGMELIGKNLLDCHPEPSKTMLEQMLAKQISNVYTIEKRGLRKLIYQTPLYDKNKLYAGFMELILELPVDMKHFER